MENLKKALNEMIEKAIKLSIEWDKVLTAEANKIDKKYPLNKDFDEFIADLIVWRDTINEEIQKEKDSIKKVKGF